jgi:hypothetical protein
MGAKKVSAPVGISLREFARRDGCSDRLVRNAVSSGKLKVFADGRLDPALVGSGWRKTNRNAESTADESAPADDDLSAKLRAGDVLTLADAERVKASALALKHLLAAGKSSGQLVEAEAAERILFEEARAARDSWLNWPARNAPMIAAELGVTVEAVVETLDRHVRVHLSELGEPDARFREEAEEILA